MFKNEDCRCQRAGYDEMRTYSRVNIRDTQAADAPEKLVVEATNHDVRR